MEIRIMGTERECEAFGKIILEVVPNEYIRNISRFYANRRQGSFSNEGRMYFEFENPDIIYGNLITGRKS